MFTDLQSHLANAKFLHIVFEWGLPWGIFLGFILLAASRFLLKDRKAEVAALLIIAGSAMLVWPVSHFREKAKPIGSQSVEKLKQQTTRRQETAWVFYALAALACVTAAAGGESGGTAGKLLFWMLFLAAIAATAVALWLQIKECELFYRDL